MWLQKSLLRACDWEPGSGWECYTLSYILILEPPVARVKSAEWILNVFPNHLLGDSVVGYNLMEGIKRREKGLLLCPFFFRNCTQVKPLLWLCLRKEVQDIGKPQRVYQDKGEYILDTEAWAFRQRTFLIASIDVWLLKVCCLKDEICNRFKD